MNVEDEAKAITTYIENHVPLFSRLILDTEKKLAITYVYEWPEEPLLSELVGYKLEWLDVPPIGAIGDELAEHLQLNNIPYYTIEWHEQNHSLEVFTEKPSTVTIDIFKATPVKWSLKNW